MKRILRIAGLAFALLLLFLAAVAFTTGWLKRQNDQLLADTLRTRSVAFTHLLALADPGPPPWTAEFTRDLGRAMGGEITVHPASVPPLPTVAATDSARWRFDQELRDAAGERIGVARVQLRVPPTVRVQVMFHRVAALLLSLALLLLLTIVLLVVLARPWSNAGAREPQPTDAAHVSEYAMLGHFAARSARQTAELEQEREDRQRAEADAHLKQVLLNRALQEKIDMGRDLHDGLIQSLYATGLTIQAGRKALDHDPATARAQIDSALQTLNAAIREVRAYISNLGPTQLQQRNFADSVRAVIAHHGAARELVTDIRIDEEAAAQLAPAQVTDLLQITREAVSNSLRHGQARSLSIRLHRNGDELCLLLHDDGRGFDAQQIARGHGLDNMQARADRLAARLRCHSAPGQGTRLVLTFAAPTPAVQP